MDIADRCAILSNERINPRFRRAAHAIESPEPRKIAPLINRPAAAPNPRHESIIQRSENMRPRIENLAFGTGHPTMPPIVPLSRAHLTGLSILSTKDSNSQALNRAHLWIPWTIKHPMIYRDLHPRVVFVRVECRSTWRTLSFRNSFSFDQDQG